MSKWWESANPEALTHVRERQLEPLEWDELRARLEVVSEPPSFPLDEIRIAQAAWPRYAAGFREAFAHELAHGDLADSRRALHIFAGYLLAEHRDTECFAQARHLLSMSPDELGLAFGDDWHMSASAWVAAFCCSNAERIRWLETVLLDPDAWAHHRLTAASALVRCSAAHGVERTQQVLLEGLASVAQSACRVAEDDYQDPASVMGLLMCDLMDLGVPHEAMPTVEGWFARKLVAPDVVTLADVRRELAAGKVRPVPSLPGCTVKEIGWWAWFTPTASPSVQEPIYIHRDPRLPVVREEPKIGRNDPCPCGSGRKFKKCCGA